MFLVCMESSKSPESSFLSNPKIYSYVILLKNKLVRACSLYSWLFSFHVCTIVYLWQCKTARMFIWKSTSSYVFSVGFTFNHWLDFRFTSLFQQHSNIIHYYWVVINLFCCFRPFLSFIITFYFLPSIIIIIITITPPHPQPDYDQLFPTILVCISVKSAVDVDISSAGVKGVSPCSAINSCEEMSMDEIFNGKGKYYPGLIPLVYAYLDYIK